MPDVVDSYVMTLNLDDRSFKILQEWRVRHFPPRRNFIPAHLSLLHKISLEQVCRLRAAWRIFENQAPVPLKYVAPRLLGNGVAIDVESPALMRVRTRLIDVLAGSITRQDQQPFRAHVTIQNKVAASEAKALQAFLSPQFVPWCGCGTGVMIWKYLGGPWELDSLLSFCGVQSDDAGSESPLCGMHVGEPYKSW